MNTESNAIPSSAVESPAIAPPAIPATRRMYWAVRRELWENRSIYLAPLAVAALILVGFLISTIRLPAKMRAASALGPMQEHNLIAQPYLIAAGLMMLTTLAVGVFYSLDALYGAARSQHLILEVAAGFRSHDCAQGDHPVVILRWSPSRSPLTQDHAAGEHLVLLGAVCVTTLVPCVAVQSWRCRPSPPDRSWTLVRANMAGCCRCRVARARLPGGRPAAACDRRGREDRVQHVAFGAMLAHRMCRWWEA
jgi:hypothetical protein